MTDSNSNIENIMLGTDLFVMIDNGDSDVQNFVFIDEDYSNDIMIDMTQENFLDAVTIDYGFDNEIGNFVQTDDYVIVSDFTENDLIDVIDLSDSFFV